MYLHGIKAPKIIPTNTFAENGRKFAAREALQQSLLHQACTGTL